MKTRTIFLVIAAWLLITAAPAHASFISLPTSLSAKYENHKLLVKVSVANQGDETTYNIQAEVLADGKSVLAEKMAELPINVKYQVEIPVPLAPKTPGSYPLALAIHYTDANQYPFTALLAQTFAYEKETTSPVFGQLKPLSFTKDGQLELSLKNGGESPLKLKINLWAPRELTLSQVKNVIELAPKAELQKSFAVKNFSALPGSTYQVFAIAEFEAGGRHYTSLIPGVVKIVASQNFFGLSYTAIYIILGLLIAAFIAAQFIKRGK